MKPKKKSNKDCKRTVVSSPYFKENPTNKIELNNHALPGKQNLGYLRLTFPSYDVPCVALAKSLLGKVLVRVLNNGTILKGLIVETESYLGGEDKASISYGGKITERSKPMYMKPGTTFVYLTYGMYDLLNISSNGDGAAVLLRALDPIEGIEEMAVNRNKFYENKKSALKKLNKEIPTHQLCNGPAKLCISLDITKEKCNMQDLSVWSGMWVEQGTTVSDNRIVNTRRIGIDSAGPEWANKHLRFYILNNKSVSKRDKAQEILCSFEKR